MKNCYLVLVLSGLLVAGSNTTGAGIPTPVATTAGGTDVGLAVSAGADVAKALSLTDAEVKTLGMQSVAKSDKEERIATAKDKYAKRLSKLAAKHQTEDGLKLNFKVYLSKEINAFASPDGSIRVYSGLMDMMTDDELHYVIGHEIGHVKLNHSLSAYRAEFLARATRKGIAASNSTAGSVAKSNFAGLIEEAFNAQYSQEAERQADDYGLNFNKKHKYSPKAAISALEKLAKLSDSEGGVFASHPAPDERAKRLKNQLGK